MKIFKVIFQEWRLESTTKEPVTLTFATFDLYNCEDFVEINDGSGSSSQRYCDSNPGTLTGTNITVKLHTNGFDAASGFMATVCCSANITTYITGE